MTNLNCRFVSLLVAGALLGATLVGCGNGGGPDEAGGPEAWKKLDEGSKLSKIKNMPLSEQQKIEMVNGTKATQAEKDAAIDEIRAGGGSSAVPANPGSSAPPR